MNKTKPSRGPWLWPLLLVVIGVVLLLHNFLLLGSFNVLDLWPVVLVLLGAQILLRGDFLPSADARTFGITRGSVQSATLEISSGEVDVELQALQREGRLIAGQYAHQSRPALSVSDAHAHLRMFRSSTPWLSFADWQLGLARDLPWQILSTSYLGQVNMDLTGLIIQNVVVATGIGDIRLVCPYEAFEPLYLRSALGNLHVVTPTGHNIRIHVTGSRLLRIHADESRYAQIDDAFVARDAGEDAPLVEVHLSGTFGDVYLT